ncbi:MAG: hypothetical protein R3B60_03445 [Candidatus Paceibacterota bacterium]
MSQIKIIFSTFYLFLITLLFFASFNQVLANESFGWFSPRVEYIDDSATVNCSANQASIELWLVDRDTETLISNSIGKWTVKIKDSLSNQTEILTRNYNAVNKSESLCFDPTKNGLQVLVLNSANYKPFSAPALFPDSSNTAALEAMRGSHFKGYVQLSPVSESSPNTTSSFPNNGAIATSSVEFLVETNKLTSLYNTNNVTKIKLYLEDHASGDIYTKEVSTSGGIGTRAIPLPTGVPDGKYFWSFHEELDGESTTERLSSPEWTWTFGSIPVSGLPSVKSITIDTTPPSSQITDFKVVSEESPSTVSVSVTQSLADSHAGLANSQLYVENLTTGSTYGIIPSFYPSFTTSTSVTYILGSFSKSDTYRFYIVSTDNIGNTTTSSNYDYSVPLSLSVPEVNLYSYSSIINGVNGVTNSTAWLYGTTTDAHTNYLPVTETGVCWTTSLSDANSTSTLLSSGTCNTRTSGYNSSNSTFYFYVTNLPASTTVYFRMMAKNDAGWGFSPVGSFTTDLSPFDPTAGTPTPPTVGYYGSSITNPDYINPQLGITNAGYSLIEEYGICYSTDQLSINALDPLKLNAASSTYDSAYAASWASSCYLQGPLPSTTTIPYYKRIGISGLSNGTDYYLKVFAVNSIGAGSADGMETTDTLNYKFLVTQGWGLPEISTSSSIFDDTTNTYDKIEVSFAAQDQSFDTASILENPTRQSNPISYLVSLDIGDNLSIEDNASGPIQTLKQGSNPTNDFDVDWDTVKTVEFYNIPINTPIRITIEVNEPETYSQSDLAGKSYSTVFTLSDPNSLADSSSGTGSDSGNALDVDPEFDFSANPSLIRSGSTTTIEWEMKSIDVDCQLTGPSSFTPLSFNPSIISGVVDSNTRVSGTVVTSLITNTQLFKLSCINATPTTFSTTTRINVLGNPGES